MVHDLNLFEITGRSIGHSKLMDDQRTPLSRSGQCTVEVKYIIQLSSSIDKKPEYNPCQ